MATDTPSRQQRFYLGEKGAGWDPRDDNTFSEEIAHLHEEASEAFRQWRTHKNVDVYWQCQKCGKRSDTERERCVPHYEPYNYDCPGFMKPQGAAIELGDVLLGMYYIAERWGFDLDEVTEVKHRYNLTRDYAAEGRRLHEPDGVERDYEGHVIGEDGMVDGPGGQRLKPVVDPWPAINAQRQAEGSA